MTTSPHHDNRLSPQLAATKGTSSNARDGSDKMTLTEARKILGISPNKMSKLVHEGTLKYDTDPLDQRVKLVCRTDVESLKQRSRKS